MGAINDIFRIYGPHYLLRFRDAIPNNHLKVTQAIIHCKSKTYGAMLYNCPQCHQPHLIFRSCGNRHCPSCQHHKTQLWLHRQMKRQLPGPHFLITFTIPEQLRPFIRANQRLGYQAMFKASSQALKTLAADKQFIGADLPGFWGILHTWGRQLQYHPHVHYIAPGGALSTKDHSWHPSRSDFFLPVRALSRLFRAKFRDEISVAGLLEKIDPLVWEIDWNVHSQAVGETTSALKYLAPYVFRVAISNARIVKVEDHKVFFRYRKPKSNRWRTMALDAMEFIRRFLQHVLPTGFMKIRHYGFLSPSSSIPLPKASLLIQLASAFQLPALSHPPDPPVLPAILCRICGSPLIYHHSCPPPHQQLLDTG